MKRCTSQRLVFALLLLALALIGCTARSRGETEPPHEPDVTLAPGQSDDGGVPEPDATDDGADGDDGGDGDPGGDLLSFDPDASFVAAPQLRVQFSQFPDARIAGFFAAEIQNFYADQEIEVLVEPALPDADPIEAIKAEDGPQFLFAPALLAMKANADGLDLVNIAQIYQRSGMHIATLTSSGITAPAGVGTMSGSLSLLPYGRDMDALAALKALGTTIATGKSKVVDPFDPIAFVGGDPAASQVTYEDEYARILETEVSGGQLINAADVTLIDLSTGPQATLQEGLYARRSWLEQTGNDQIAVRFLRAVFRGFIYCRDNLDDCAQESFESGGQLPTQHQKWVLNEANALIWPSPSSLGTLDMAAWQQTANLGKAAGFFTNLPPADMVRLDLQAAALTSLSDVDTMGSAFVKATVDITPGGEDPAQP